MGFKSKIRLMLLLSCLNKSLAKSCPSCFPRSGKEANQVNCFVVLFDDGENPYILVTGTEKDNVLGKQWNPSERKYAVDTSIPISCATTRGAAKTTTSGLA